jgi:hypothetical protein
VLTRRTVHKTRFFSLRWAALLILGPLLGLIAVFVVFMVGGASKPDGPALVAFFAVLTLPLLGLSAWVAGLTLRPVILTRSALRIPYGFKTVVIPVDDVAGVGLLYHSFRPRTQSANAWSVFVWRRNGSVLRAGTLVCRRGPDPAPSQIARSRAARMAKRLHDKIRTIQGSAGSLATLELQKQASTGLASDMVAFWSPDGAIGPTRY